MDKKTSSDKKKKVGARSKVTGDDDKTVTSSFATRNAALQGDSRFSGVLSNPIFRSVPKNEKKISIDSRFQSMFQDEGSFKLKYKVDKRGKPINSTTDENLRKYYNLEDEDEDKSPGSEEGHEEGDVDGTKVKSESESSDSEESSDDQAPDPSTSTPTKLTPSIKKLLHSSKVDYARGEGAFASEESSDSDSSSEEAAAGSEEEVDHDWGELDKDAPRTESSTRRLALCNMDWDRVKAADLMVLFSSFLPPSGVLSRVTIYPSAFGKERMKEEEVKGPAEFQQFKREVNPDEEEMEERDPDASEDEEGSDYHREKMRQYQLNRLRYYYAVLEFNSAAAAEMVYGECDGMEYESSAAKIDLRFIPDDTSFEGDEPRESCDAVPDGAKYRPKFFTTTALQQVKVACTWDETDPSRKELISRVLDPKDKVEDEDLRAYLASSSEEEEDEEGQGQSQGQDDGEKGGVGGGGSDPIAKYRQLLDSINEKEASKKKDVELEITWGVGLKQKAEELVKKRSKEEDLKKMTPWEERLVRQKEKRRLKKAGKETSRNSEDDTSDSEDEDKPFSDDDVDVDMNDPFFKEELGVGRSKNKKNNRKKDDKVEDVEDKSKGALDLLLLDENETDGKKHFNFKKIVESEVETKSRRKRKLMKRKKKAAAESSSTTPQNGDDFQVDVGDSRFSALFSSHHYNIDPSEPNFKRTKGMETIIQEKQRKRIHQPEMEMTSTTTPDELKTRKNRAELAVLVNSIKNKTQGAGITGVNKKPGGSSQR